MTSTATSAHHDVHNAQKDQKYVLFGLGGETYGLLLHTLREILAAQSYTVTPNLPSDFHGVVGVRGEIIPVVNLRARFGYSEQQALKKNRVLIVDLKPNPLGVHVDEVFGVVTLPQTQIEPPPELTCGQRIPYVVGVSEFEHGKLVIHLDMEKVLSSLEKIQLADMADSIREAYQTSKTNSSATTVASEK